MTYIIIFIVIAILEIAGGVSFLWYKFGRVILSTKENIDFLTKSLTSCQELDQKFKAVYEKMLPYNEMYAKGKEYIAIQESLKAERGRITITKAELESVENRLMELDVIEQELAASADETNHEIETLAKRKNDLDSEKDTLIQQIADLTDILDQSGSIINGNENLAEAVSTTRESVIEVQSHLDKLLENIKAENDQYFVVKQRYDALDIEYAQLFEKFALPTE